MKYRKSGLIIEFPNNLPASLNATVFKVIGRARAYFLWSPDVEQVYSRSCLQDFNTRRRTSPGNLTPIE
jgi:hypothetical protein